VEFTSIGHLLFIKINMGFMKQLVFAFIFTFYSLLYPMTLDRVILSTDTNSMYYEFWPLVARAWTKIVGVKPTLALIAPKDFEIDESLGDVIRFEPLEGVPTSLQAQVIRLLLPAYYPEDVCIISDIDMLPTQKSYYVDSILECSEDAFVVFRDKAYPEEGFKRYPMCYLAAKGKTFQKLFELDSLDQISEKIYAWHSLNLGWNTDERVVFRAIQNANDVAIDFLGHRVEKRIDRINWRFGKQSLARGFYIDAHLLRPYSQYKDQVDYIAKKLGL